jgi:hypothetical protein
MQFSLVSPQFLRQYPRKVPYSYVLSSLTCTVSLVTAPVCIHLLSKEGAVSVGPVCSLPRPSMFFKKKTHALVRTELSPCKRNPSSATFLLSFHPNSEEWSYAEVWKQKDLIQFHEFNRTIFKYVIWCVTTTRLHTRLTCESQ